MKIFYVALILTMAFGLNLTGRTGDFPADAQKLFMQQECEVRNAALSDLLASWAAENHIAATEWIIKTLPEEDIRFRALRKTVPAWGEKDPASAIAWALKLPEGETRERALAYVVPGWARKDIGAVSEWLMKLPKGKARNMGLQELFDVWVRKEPEAAFNFAVKLEAGQTRTDFMFDVGSYWASVELDKASDRILKMKDWSEITPLLRDRIIVAAAHAWAKKNPGVATAWAMKLPEGVTTRDAALLGIASVLALKDPLAAMEWAMKLPEGELRKSAVGMATEQKKISESLSRKEHHQKNLKEDLRKSGRDTGKTPGNPTRLTADPVTGCITVETDRYSARLDAGVMTRLYSKLSKRILIDGARPASKSEPVTALAVQEKPLSAPVYRSISFEGANKTVVNVVESNSDRIVVRFTGLTGAAMDFHPEDSLTLEVAVAPDNGDMLVTLDGVSRDSSAVGTRFGFAGLTRHYVFYSPNAGGTKQVGDTESKGWMPLPGRLEWTNMSMGKRTGVLSGWPWSTPLTLIASGEDQKSAFSFWCEDDELKCKYYFGGRDSVSHATFEYPPFDDVHRTRSVTWRINTYAGGWTEAAKPYADSLVRRGFTKDRAPWRNDISLIIQLSDLSLEYLKALEEIFPPAERRHIMLYVQGWRNAGFDHSHWDYTPSPTFISGAEKARAAGFHTLVYMQPMYCWGDANMIEDAELRSVVQKIQQHCALDPFGRHYVKHSGLNLAYAPWRNLLIGAARNVIGNYGVQGMYWDSSFMFMNDGRGRIDGMTVAEGTHALLDGVRKMNPDLFMGTEWPNELMAWGTDFGLHSGLEWAGNYKEPKAHNSHPIQNYCFQDVMVTMTHNNDPDYRSVRDFHLCEEISERTGQVAAMSFDDVKKLTNLNTPEKRLWMKKARLFAHRGLRPYYPVNWEDGVMSYLKAGDGTVFCYRETPYGSDFVEQAKNGSIRHWGRIWKQGEVKTDKSFGISNWPARADDGTWLGLDEVENAYVLLPDAPVEERVRIISMPKDVFLKTPLPPNGGKQVCSQDMVNDQYAVFYFAPRKAKDLKSPTQAVIRFQLQKPLLRLVAAAGEISAKVLRQDKTAQIYEYEASVPLDGPVGMVWAADIALPFEYCGKFALPLPSNIQKANEIFFKLMDCDPLWNADATGMRNPRPGSAYSFTAKVRNSGTGTGELIGFVCGDGKTPVFNDHQSVKVDGKEFTELVFAGSRKLESLPSCGKSLFIRMYSDKAKPVEVAAVHSISFIRPELGLSDRSPINLGKIAPRTPSKAAPSRTVFNSQKNVAERPGAVLPTMLCGTAHLAAPDAKTTDDVGVILVGGQAELFELIAKNATADGMGVKLIGADAKSGLLGGEKSETEEFAVRFRGTDKPGVYRTSVRIVTQAANSGTKSSGKEGEPIANLYYIDIPVTVTVE